MVKEKQEDALVNINTINGLHLARHSKGLCSEQSCSTLGVLGGIVTNTLAKVRVQT